MIWIIIIAVVMAVLVAGFFLQVTRNRKIDDRIEAKLVNMMRPDVIQVEITPADAMTYELTDMKNSPIAAAIRKKYPSFKEINCLMSTVDIDGTIYTMSPAYTMEVHQMLRSLASDPLIAPAYVRKINLYKM